MSFNNEAAFLSSVTPSFIESFESYSPTYTKSTLVTTTLFSVTTTPTAGGTSYFYVGTTDSGDPHATDGINALIAGSVTGDPWFLTFQLDVAVNAVAFDLTDAAEGGQASIRTGAGDNAIIANCCQPGGNELFFGLINTSASFTTFTLTNTGFDDGWGIDRIQFGDYANLVPEPETYALMLAGLGLLGFVARQRKTKL